MLRKGRFLQGLRRVRVSAGEWGRDKKEVDAGQCGDSKLGAPSDYGLRVDLADRYRCSEEDS